MDRMTWKSLNEWTVSEHSTGIEIESDHIGPEEGSNGKVDAQQSEQLPHRCFAIAMTVADDECQEIRHRGAQISEREPE